MTILQFVHLCFVKLSEQTVIASTYVTALPSRYTDWVAGSSTDRAKRAYFSKISGPNLGATRTTTLWFAGVKLITHLNLVQNLGILEYFRNTRILVEYYSRNTRVLVFPYLLMVFAGAQFLLSKPRFSWKLTCRCEAGI